MAAVAPTSTDCVAYYKFENNADDATPNGNDGTNNGATYDASGKVGGCYDFDGSNDYVSTGYRLSSSRWSVSVWFKKDGTPTAVESIFSDYDADGHYDGLFIRINTSNQIIVYTGGTDENWHIYTSDVISDLTWYHITVTYDRSVRKIYINGVLKETTADFTFRPEATATINIGTDHRNTPTEYFSGLIDEVSIFDVALTADNVEYLYNSGSPGIAQQYPFSGGSTGWAGKINGLDYSDVAKVNGIAKASIAKINGEDVS